MVQHMINSSSYIDSTKFNNDGTIPWGGPVANGSSKINGGVTFAGNWARADVDDNGSIRMDGDMTASFWLKTTGFNPTSQTEVMFKINWPNKEGFNFLDDGNYNDWFIFRVHGNNTYYDATTTRASINDGSWHYITGRRSGTDIYLYVDGQQISVTNNTNMDICTSTMMFGSNGDDSDDVSLDEIRVSNIDRGAAWIETEYNNQNNPSAFFAEGAEETGPGPVGYWSFDEGYGTVAHDESGQGNDGTVMGAIWKGEEECVSGKCLWFNDTTNYVDLGDSDNLSFVANGSDSAFSFSSWIYMNDATLFPIITKAQELGMGEWTIYLDSDDKIKFLLVDTDDDYIGRFYNTPLTTLENQWVHIAGSYDGSESSSGITIFINGQRLDDANYNSGTYNGMTNTASRVGIGVIEYAGAFAAGKIDEVKIYPYARTADQIKQDYNAGLAGVKANTGVSASFGGTSDKWMSDGLVGYWKFDESATTSGAIDSSGNGNTGTYYGDASTTAGKFGNSYIGTGIDGDHINISSDAGDELDFFGSFSIVLWVKPNDIANRVSWIEKYWSDSYKLGRYINGDNIAFFINGTGINGGDCIIGEWMHVVAVYDSRIKTARIYKNSDRVAQGIVDPPEGDSNSDLRIGGRQNDDHFNGQIDEVRIYNRALSPSEVKKLYEWAPGPVAHWKFDEMEGTTAYDSVASSSTAGGNDLNIHGASWAKGKYGSSLKFNGENEYAATNVPQGSPLDLVGDFSISFWTTPDSIPSNMRWIDRDYASSYCIARDNVGSQTKIRFMVGGLSITGGSTAAGETMHISAVYERATQNAILYKNGIIVASGAVSVPHSNSNFLAIGRKYSIADNYFDGTIDDVRIYNYARTQKQILEDMNNGAANKSPVLHLSFDEGYGGTAYDSSIYENNGLLYPGTDGSNTSSSSMWTKNGRVNGAMEFDGDSDYIGVNSSENLNLDDEYSVAIWLKPYKISGFNFVINQSDSGVYKQFGMDIYNNDLRVGWNGYMFTQKYPGEVNQWAHIVFIRSGSTGNYTNMVYSNGKKYAEETNIATNPGSQDNLFLGKVDGFGLGFFYGLIDEVKIWNYALSEDEIKTEYNSGKATVMGEDASRDNDGTAVTGGNKDYCVPGDSAQCDGPVLELSFDEKSGTTTYDTSGNGNDGVFVNSASSPTWQHAGNCIHGACLEFDGTDDYIDMGGRDSLKIQGDLTISTWVKPTALKISSIFDSYYIDWVGFRFLYNEERRIYFECTKDSDGSSQTAYTDTLPVITNIWQQLSVTKSGTNIIFYRNGSIIDEKSIEEASMKKSVVNATIGYSHENDLYLNGLIDDVKIYNYARTPAQIAWDYNRGKPIAHWIFDECSGGVIHDYAGTNHGQLYLGTTGTTATGTCASSSDSFWYNGRSGAKETSAYFDGEDDYVDIGDTSLNINSISFWIKQGYTDANIIDLDGGTHTITLSNGTVTATGFSSPTIYINGQANSTIPNSGWHHVLITTATAIDANNMDIGRISTDYFSGQLDELKLYNYELTAVQAKTDYSGGAISFGATPNQSGSALVSSWNCGDSVYNSNDSITYSTVLADDGNCWLASNLGTANIATAYNDSSAYGAYYQWGRLADGHQVSTSDTTSTNSAGDVPGHDDFITEGSSPL
jgi:hypothetical protein